MTFSEAIRSAARKSLPLLVGVAAFSAVCGLTAGLHSMLAPILGGLLALVLALSVSIVLAAFVGNVVEAWRG